MKKFTLTAIASLFVLGATTANAGSAERAAIAAKLFNLSASSMYYDYNPWATPWSAKNGLCVGYDGGHSGLDIQTKDKSTSRGFYALTGGKVIAAGGGSYNTIAVYDSITNRTVLYLHASRVTVSLNQTISPGALIGYQGDRGATGAFHVHLELRSGSRTGPACGASTTLNPEVLANAQPPSYDGQLPTTAGCDADGATVQSKAISGGVVELRWSNRCKTNWTRVRPNSSTSSTIAKITRNSDGRNYSSSGRGSIFTPMVYAPSTTACASGAINGISASGICR